MEMAPKKSNSLWIFLSCLAGTVLFLHIYLPALNKSLWYDDLDGLMYGEFIWEQGGQLDLTPSPPPVDIYMLDSEGKCRAYQPLWLLINSLAFKLEIPMPFWKAIHIFFLIFAIGFYAFWHLKGAWLLAPWCFALFSDLVFRSGSLVRGYNLAAALIVLCLYFWQRRQKRIWPFILCLIFLWQTNLGGFVLFAVGHSFFLLSELVKKKNWKQLSPVFLTYCGMGLSQIYWMRNLRSDIFSYDLTAFEQFVFSVTATNFQVCALILLVPLIAHAAIQNKGNARWALSFIMASLVIVPLAVFFRSVYLIMVLPIFFVEITSSLKNLKQPWGILLFFLGAFTQSFSLPLQTILPERKPDSFYSPIPISQDWFRKTPLASLFEARHRKWTRDDAETTYLLENIKPDDHILYAFSRLNVLARLWHEMDIRLTGIFRPGFRGHGSHSHILHNPQTHLREVETPFWALTPQAISKDHDLEITQAGIIKELSKYGRVEVHPIPKRNQDWLPNDKWPPEKESGPSNYVVFYVTAD